MAPIASPRKNFAPKYGLDAKAEYLDVDGVPRRSESVTRRMIQRGMSISKSALLTDADQAHMSLEERQRESEQRSAMLLEELAELQKKQEASAKFKAHTKSERRRWIDESYELVALRLDILYSNEYVAKDDENVDVTERNTPLTPSKSQRYIDDSGNLRCKSVVHLANAVAVEEPAEQPMMAKDHNIYIQVTTPPVSPGVPPSEAPSEPSSEPPSEP